MKLRIYSVVLLAWKYQLYDRVWKFFPEVMAMIYACGSFGDMMTSYVLVKQGSGEHPLQNATWTYKICKTPQNNPKMNNILWLGNYWLYSCSNALRVHTCIPRNFMIPWITVCSLHIANKGNAQCLCLHSCKFHLQNYSTNFNELWCLMSLLEAVTFNFNAYESL